MASLVELIPTVCVCGNNIGKLQIHLEEKMKMLDFHQAIHAVFNEKGGYRPRMCCLTQCVKPQVYIPNNKMDTVYVDNSKNMETVVSVYEFKPRLPPKPYPQFF